MPPHASNYYCTSPPPDNSNMLPSMPLQGLVIFSTSRHHPRKIYEQWLLKIELA